MTTPHLKKSIGRSPSRLALLIPLVFACIALAQSAQAVAPQADEGDLIGNIAEEDDAVAELGSDTVKAAMGQAANTPNKREIPINIIKPLQCAGGTVILRGTLVVTFHQSDGSVKPISLKLERFSGTATPGNRKLVAKNLRSTGLQVEQINGLGAGKFDFEFNVTGPGLPGGSPLRIRVLYQINKYIFNEGKVKKLTLDDRPVVRCQN